MSIQVGDRLPEATFTTMTAEGVKPLTTAEVFAGRKVVLFSVPGAFTPTWPASVKWDSGTAPTYTTPSLYVFTTLDSGTTWLGSQVGKAFA